MRSVKLAHCAGVVAIQRGGSALNANLHFHFLAVDGVFIQHDADAPVISHSLPAPSRPELAQIAWQVAVRSRALLERAGKGFDVDPTQVEGLLQQEPLLADCATASLLDTQLFGEATGQRTSKQRVAALGQRGDGSQRPAHGFDLHAGVRVSANDRGGLERLCRYIARPIVSHERLSRLPDGRVRVELKRAWSDGTTHVVLSPHDFIARLVALVPPARVNQIRYFGAFAPRSKVRAQVVPQFVACVELLQPELFGKAGQGVVDDSSRRDDPSPEYRRSWAKLLHRVFDVDALRCDRCQRTMRIVAFVTEPHAIVSILRGRGYRSVPPALHPARGPPQLRLPFGASAASELLSA